MWIFFKKISHSVTIFEAMPKLGGMLRYGIPGYRLPQEILDLEISEVINLGIEARYKMGLGRDFSLKDLIDQGYEAIFLALVLGKIEG